MSVLSGYAPDNLWSQFEALAAVPRPSGHEEAALQMLEARLDDYGIEHWRDHTGNLMMRKPASAGMEDRPRVVLQSHVDMVPQKADGVEHDFTTDPITLQIEDGWLTAKGTTLGADNGIGVATIMAVMADKTMEHGPLEALITIDEERGLRGAQEVEPGRLNGEILLNLDSEDEGELFVGCAGGADLEARFPYRNAGVPLGLLFFKIRVWGLKGGHSGIDIHQGRGNAIQIMARFLSSQHQGLKMGLASFTGGTLRNAIAREAEIIVGIPKRFAEEFDGVIAAFRSEIEMLYKATDPNIRFEATPLSVVPDRMLEADFVERLLTALRACPSHAVRMSAAAPGVTETSNNLALIRMEDNEIVVGCMTRSLIKTAQDDLVDTICQLFRLAGAEVTVGNSFAGWTPNPESPVLAKAQALYKEMTGQDPKINVIHAGLECGLLGAAYPNWDMISFGPNIRGAHSPDERVEIESVNRFWEFFKVLLTRL